ncbi:MAG: helix-turn-helix domain-containing protein [Acetobacter sp.]|jgi:phage repressor protein C with HTH and peptisase S24 domain|nr:helix-turn-helix domain-containing protein [Acetobacter sp.]MCH4060469.1 helix-turn-helix domain-containing protein [Acetobacter sp.]MCH4087409.1 helix-turn-helix domain-containing protein [Acetobacter sp.]MCI1293927.1 helix-turn-helix domain-containing protein [Acetobacter sp.]MCI1320479.1 helix-turn-helix domain-containing protein [Acetobacter sp.]
MSFADELRLAMSQFSITNAELAEKFGVSSQAISQWIAGTTRPKSERQDKVREYLRQRGQLQDSLSNTDHAPDKFIDGPPGYAPIEFLSTKAGMGGYGIILDDYVKEQKYFEETFIKNELRASPSDLMIVQVEGQSMEPILQNGDTVIIDKRKNNCIEPGIFVLFDGDGIVCKWIERVHGSDIPKIRVKSENKRFSDYEIISDQCKIFGRVVWFSRKL